MKKVYSRKHVEGIHVRNKWIASVEHLNRWKQKMRGLALTPTLPHETKMIGI